MSAEPHVGLERAGKGHVNGESHSCICVYVCVVIVIVAGRRFLKVLTVGILLGTETLFACESGADKDK